MRNVTVKPVWYGSVWVSQLVYGKVTDRVLHRMTNQIWHPAVVELMSAGWRLTYGRSFNEIS